MYSRVVINKCNKVLKLINSWNAWWTYISECTKEEILFDFESNRKNSSNMFSNCHASQNKDSPLILLNSSGNRHLRKKEEHVQVCYATAWSIEHWSSYFIFSRIAQTNDVATFTGRLYNPSKLKPVWSHIV